MLNPMDLTGRRILVAGASSGIGEACAVKAAELGAVLVLLGRDQVRLEKTLAKLTGDGHELQVCDLTEPDQIKGIAGAANLKERPLSGIVYSAGMGNIAPLNVTSPEALAKIFQVNYFGFVEVLRVLVQKRFFREPGGSVVGISSISSLIGWRGGGAYCGSKGAMDATIRALALEYAGRGIRFNSVVPAYVRTPMADKTSEDLVDVTDVSRDQYVRQTQPLGWGETEDVANAVCFILSDAARFITGSSLVVDGGALAQ